MAYGINVYNEYGETVLDMAYPTYYAFEAGSTVTWDSLRTAGINAATAAGYTTHAHYNRDGYYTTEISTTVARSQVACGTGTYTLVTTGPNKALIHPEMNLQEGDIPFYDISTYGLLCAYAMIHNGFSDSTPDGGIGICEVEGNNSIGYTIASTRKPIPSPSDDFGLQLFNAAGGVTFDSRQDLFSIYDHFYISKEILTKVIQFGLTMNLNLSESHADFKVAAFNHISQLTFTGGARYLPMIKKVDNDTISISRYNAGTATESGTFRILVQDMIIIIGR